MKNLLYLALAGLLTVTTASATTTQPPAKTTTTTAAATAKTSLEARVNLTDLNEAQYIKAKQAQQLAMVNTTTDTSRMAAEVAQQMRGLYVPKPRPTVRPLRSTVPAYRGQRLRKAYQRQELEHPAKLAPLPLEDRD